MGDSCVSLTFYLNLTWIIFLCFSSAGSLLRCLHQLLMAQPKPGAWNSFQDILEPSAASQNVHQQATGWEAELRLECRHPETGWGIQSSILTATPKARIPKGRCFSMNPEAGHLNQTDLIIWHFHISFPPEQNVSCNTRKCGLDRCLPGTGSCASAEGSPGLRKVTSRDSAQPPLSHTPHVPPAFAGQAQHLLVLLYVADYDVQYGNLNSREENKA